MNPAERRITPDADTAPLDERHLVADSEQRLLASHLHDLTHEHEDTDLLERFLLEVETTEWPDETKSRVYAALGLAKKVHEGQMRGSYHPYSTHFLRVATRILSTNASHFSIRDQPSLIIAALLHDSVEDQPVALIRALTRDSDEGATEVLDKLTQQQSAIDALEREDPICAKLKLELQQQALAALGQYFGEEVQDLVGAVTNPPSNYMLLKTDRNKIYRQHVEELLENNPFTGIIKISDFIDNAAGLSYNDKEPEKVEILAVKYVDLVPVFIEFVTKSSYFSPDVKKALTAKLKSIAVECIKRKPEPIPSAEPKTNRP